MSSVSASENIHNLVLINKDDTGLLIWVTLAPGWLGTPLRYIT